MPDPSRRPRLLVVSHEASQTGAPIVLVTFLEWLSTHADLTIHTLLVEDGPLRSRFEALGSVSVVTDRPGAATLAFLERGLVYRGHRRSRLAAAAIRYRAALASLGRFDLVYLNSLTTLDVIPHLTGSPPIVAHLHEGPVTIGEWQKVYGFRPDKGRPQRWIAVSEETAAAIGALPGVEAARVLLHHPFIDVAAIRRNPQTDRAKATLRSSLGIPPEASVVIGSGSIERRKGPDLFIQLAAQVQRDRRDGDPPVHFLWVGGDLSGPEWPLLQAEIERSGVEHVHVTGHVADPRALYQLGDVFALTSREDPFPLVCLEHAALGVPVVAYSSSGIRDLLRRAGEEAAHCVIPYLDVGSMARRVLELIASPELAEAVGGQLRQAVETHHDASTGAAAIWRDLEELATPAHAAPWPAAPDEAARELG